MKYEAQDDIKNQSRECQGRSHFASRTLGFGADFFCDQAAKHGEKDSSEQNSHNPEVELWEPVEGEAARGEWPEKFDAGALAEVH